MTASLTHNAVRVDRLRVETYPSAEAAGRAAAENAAWLLRQLSRNRETIGVIFATGASQLAMLEALVARDDIPWQQIVGLHLDEYVGLDPRDPGSFRHYLQEHLTKRVSMRAFHAIEGDAPDPAAICDRYAALLREIKPDLCLLGVGENGHLAFNDPGVADFSDPLDVKVVELDQPCREQQAAEGWFPSLDRVPRQAITITLSALLRVPHMIVSVPGERKAVIVRRTLEEPVSTACPATILRQNPGATLYLDAASAALWEPNGAHQQGEPMHPGSQER